MPKTVTRPTLFAPDEIYTEREVAERLKMSVRQARRLREERRLPSGSVFIGGMPRGLRFWGWGLNQYIADNSE
jgi:predicted methyltransferase MtxX (methanogen marker protein 4)